MSRHTHAFCSKAPGAKEEKPVPSRARCLEIGVRPQWGSLKTISESDRMRLVKKKQKNLTTARFSMSTAGKALVTRKSTNPMREGFSLSELSECLGEKL